MHAVPQAPLPPPEQRQVAAEHQHCGAPRFTANDAEVRQLIALLLHSASCCKHWWRGRRGRRGRRCRPRLGRWPSSRGRRRLECCSLGCCGSSKGVSQRCRRHLICFSCLRWGCSCRQGAWRQRTSRPTAAWLVGRLHRRAAPAAATLPRLLLPLLLLGLRCCRVGSWRLAQPARLQSLRGGRRLGCRLSRLRAVRCGGPGALSSMWVSPAACQQAPQGCQRPDAGCQDC